MNQPGQVAPSLRELAERIRGDDRAAFEALLRREWKGLIRYATTCLERGEDPEDAIQDAVQDAFVSLWRERSRIDPSADVRGLLYRMVRNRTIDERRRHALRVEREPEIRRRVLPVTTPAEALDAAELREAVRHAIDALPARRKEAFVLAHLENLSHREVAGVMGVAPQTVANQISAALAELRRTLAPVLLDNRGGDLHRSG